MKRADLLERLTLTYEDGEEFVFVSEDGRFFFQNRLPDEDGRIIPIRYTREFLQAVADGRSATLAIDHPRR